MKTLIPLLPLLALCLLSGCGNASKEEAKETLSNAKESIETFAEEHDLKNHPAVLKAKEIAKQASESYQKALEEHPKLNELAEEAERLKNELAEATASGKEEWIQKAQKAYEEAKSELDQQMEEHPELVSLAQKAREAAKKLAGELAEAADILPKESEEE